MLLLIKLLFAPILHVYWLARIIYVRSTSLILQNKEIAQKYHLVEFYL